MRDLGIPVDAMFTASQDIKHQINELSGKPLWMRIKAITTIGVAKGSDVFADVCAAIDAKQYELAAKMASGKGWSKAGDKFRSASCCGVGSTWVDVYVYEGLTAIPWSEMDMESQR